MTRFKSRVPSLKFRVNARCVTAPLLLHSGFFIAGLSLLLAVTGCGKGEPKPRDLRIFHAAGFTPVLDAVRGDAEKRLSIKLLTESSGSQVACRKLTELRRECDLIILADSELVAELLKGTCSWRLDFGADEMVLGVGVRAPHASEAEQDWPSALLKPDVRLGRTDENLSPAGFRTLLVWKLQEGRGSPGLSERLHTKCDKVVDDVARLAAMLKSGDIDYAFVYRSTCLAHDIRYVELDKAINLGAGDADYSRAEVTFEKLAAGRNEKVTVRGAPVTWTLSIPDRGADRETAARFVRYLLSEKADVLEKNGMRPIKKPAFYGTKEALQPFADFAGYGGELK